MHSGYLSERMLIATGASGKYKESIDIIPAVYALTG